MSDLDELGFTFYKRAKRAQRNQDQTDSKAMADFWDGMKDGYLGALEAIHRIEQGKPA